MGREKGRILVRGYDAHGKPFTDRIKFKPTSYVPVNDGAYTAVAIDDRRLKSVRHDSLWDCYEWRKERNQVSNGSVYGDVDPVHEFLWSAYPAEVTWDPSLVRCWFMDIEVMADRGFPKAELAEEPITLITIKDWNEDAYRTWGTLKFDPKQCEETVEYRWFNDECDMLKDFLRYWERNTPEVLSGWYLDLFDLPYLVNRIYRLLGDDHPKRLSPFGYVKERNVNIAKGNVAQTYDVEGVSVLDMLQLFKKFGITRFGNQETYRLDHIAKLILGEGKIDYADHGTLHQLYLNDPQKYVEYNVRDVRLVNDIEAAAQYVQIVYQLAHRAHCTPKEAIGTVAMWDAMCFNHLRNKGLIVTPKRRQHPVDIEGGYVKEPKPGMYDWVVSFDYASLYPSLMVEYNISPDVATEVRIDTSVDKCLELLRNGNKDSLHRSSNINFTARGDGFGKDHQGFIPEMVVMLQGERSRIKTMMLDAENEKERAATERERDDIRRRIVGLDAAQNAIKVALNSGYGAMSNVHFRFFDIRMAEGITLSGQLAIKWVEYCANLALNTACGTEGEDYVIAIDTDSLYLNLGPLVEKHFGDLADGQVAFALDELCRTKFADVFENALNLMHVCMGTYRQYLKLDRELICHRGIWSGKKKYALNVLDKEGVRYKEPKLVVKGLESVRSSTPKVVRDAIKDTIRDAFVGDERAIRDIVKDRRKWFYGLTVEEVSFPRGVTDVDAYKLGDGYKSGTPIHVRAAILHNGLIKSKRLEDRYQPIRSGDKIKYVYLMTPNPIGENVIGYIDVLPEEFGLHDYVDYKLQFEKSFLAPIENLFGSCGWNVRGGGNLADFF